MRLKTIIAAAATGALLALTPAPATASVGTTASRCPQPNGRVTSVAISGTTAFLGGSFTSVKDTGGVWRARSRLAAIDTSTCALLPWAPTANATVHAVHVYGAAVFIGGDFTVVNGLSRGRLAAVTASTGRASAFNPGFNRTVRALAVNSGRLYVGGDFATVGSTARSSLAAFSLTTLALDPYWKPAAAGKVTALVATPSRVYVGGRFTSLAGNASAAYLARVYSTNGAIDTTFLPRPGWAVNTVVIGPTTVYAGGEGAGGRLGIWDAVGVLQRQHVLDGGVQTLALDGTSLYAGGHFTHYCKDGTGSGEPFTCSRPLERRKAFEISLTTGGLTSWAPKFDSPLGVFAMRADPLSHRLWVGGDFTRIGTQPVSKLAVLR